MRERGKGKEGRRKEGGRKERRRRKEGRVPFGVCNNSSEFSLPLPVLLSLLLTHEVETIFLPQ